MKRGRRETQQGSPVPCEPWEPAIKVLLVDNYDSYTYNLFQLIAAEYGTEPQVLTNDDPAWADIDLRAYDAAVISPGPGRPGRERDFGRSRDVLLDGRLPVLGVCLGHQGLGAEAGADVVQAPRPRHGHLTTVTHDGDALFAGIPREFTAVRYHSLCLAEPVPDALRVTARAEDGVVMAVAHRDRPWWGVQFHPESVASEHGARLMDNFRSLARAAYRPPRREAQRTLPRHAFPQHAPGAPLLEVKYVVLPGETDTRAAFTALYRDSDPVFWLDSAHVEEGLSRFSFLGDASGPLGELLTYRVGEGRVAVRHGNGVTTACPGSIFDVLEERLRVRSVPPPHDLPFDFAGGYVGYFGYELRADCGSPHGHRAAAPDAQWLFCDRFLAVDHQERRTYLVALCRPEEPGEPQAAEDWLEATARAVRELPRTRRPSAPARPPDVRAATRRAERALARPEATYLDDIAACRRQLYAGESYELCLTNTVTLPAPEDPLACFTRLRALNPAPYGALLRFGGTWVLSASPERFLRVDRERTVESKPIKGTARRSDDPAEDEALCRSLREDPKTRAENLMIADLLRNDLGRVCEVGTVEVPKFLATESYATVHQLVSTVRGRLRPEVNAVAGVRACFPGGSMTGAPKLRSLEILDGLEQRPRGIYSGALGYLSASGPADLSIVIRTAVLHDGVLTAGTGGAILLDSDPAAEYAEILLKAAATVQALPGGDPAGSPMRRAAVHRTTGPVRTR
ncbi:aminodeoxychorismate synthase component I [Streptomyces luteireticuli]|uniref:aminodeoxychorismate synthase component I n=1 Tax=Streptomyces luteireticuli TaxID=173858 RepID=UPI003558E8C6